MKIALIQPPSRTPSFKVPPLGLAYITAVLKKNQNEAEIIDLNVENRSLSKYLSREKPEVIGISSIVTNARKALEIAKQTKKILPQSFVVIGGPYASMMGKRLLSRHMEVDATLIGEAEFTFLELIKWLHKGASLHAVQGLIFRDTNGVKSNPASNPKRNLDEIPYPAREELKHYGVSYLSVLDDNFTFDADRAERILDGIIAKRWKLNLYFWNGMRADHVTRNLLLKMKGAGCTAVNYGVESVDPDVISFIRKGVTVEQVEKAVKLTRKMGIRTNLFLMLGNPGDTVKVVDEIMKFVEKVHVDGVHLSMATPLLGTEFWYWVEKNGTWLDYDREELLDWPVDDVEGSYPVFETSDFTADERIKAYRKARFLLQDKGYLSNWA
jgi:anaerobic magnesium-protoporphyrin IX monomethyl ester cyclase